MKRTLLIDADSFLYAAAVVHETATQWDADLWTYSGDFDAARAHLDGDIKDLMVRLEADQYIIALSDYTDPWRKKVLPTYKENRKDIRKPVLLRPLRDYCREVHPVFQRPGLEADDVVGILMTVPKAPPGIVGERVCVSLDKDMKTIPGLHFNHKKDDPDSKPVLQEVTPLEADRWHMTQTLSGDTVDGYGGCPGIGPVRSKKLLAECKTTSEMWPVVVAAYKKAGFGEDYALTQARVARILRADDFDFQLKEVRLWNPPVAVPENSTAKNIAA